ncbi:hypothetical protein FJZ18_04280 [Candidatus Pacearchaeota archaeon]|nr:hypothetical protein [Candidatus Pacearchaeota archaeon]
MTSYLVRSSKGQIKIQEMAFVLVALMIFFSVAIIFYISLNSADRKDKVLEQRENEVLETLRKLADSPELRWSDSHEECNGCIDLDKAILLKDPQRNQQVRALWNMGALSLEVISPSRTGECSIGNYPLCKTITLINSTIGSRIQYEGAFVSLCWREQQSRICEIGKIIGSPKELR